MARRRSYHKEDEADALGVLFLAAYGYNAWRIMTGQPALLEGRSSAFMGVLLCGWFAAICQKRYPLVSLVGILGVITLLFAIYGR